MEGDAVPLVRILDLRAELLQLLLRIVDQGGQLRPILRREAVGKKQVDPLAHHAGAGVEDVQKSFVLPVDVGDKMLTSPGQVQNGLQIDDLRTGGAQIRIHPGQHFQHVQFVVGILTLLLHEDVPSFYSARMI